MVGVIRSLDKIIDYYLDERVIFETVIGHPGWGLCTWLEGVGMTIEIDFVWWDLGLLWWEVCLCAWGDHHSFCFEGIIIEIYAEFGSGDFIWLQRDRHGYIRWISVFTVDHVITWEHDVWYYGYRMGGHRFMSLFTWSPLHIELSIASPLSLTRAF